MVLTSPIACKKYCLILFLTGLSLLCISRTSIQAQTYAEKLGFPKGKKVVIFHVDDAGMSYESNQGTFQAMEFGIASSCSVMMPCPWAGTFMRESKTKPALDIGLHLVLTSEWKTYRWEPLAGKALVPGLHDPEGSFWPSVAEVVAHADAEEVYTEIKAQVERALSLGISPTHLDSHMGTLFAHPDFLAKYIQIGNEYRIPVMFPGGQNILLEESLLLPLVKKLKAEGNYQEGMKLPKPEILSQTSAIGQSIWDLGLPVLDDLHSTSGDWKPEGSDFTLEELAEYKVGQFKRILEKMEPGLAMIIVHCSESTPNFSLFSSSGKSRHADLLAMQSEELKSYITEEEIILTTWREVMERRKNLEQH